MNARAERQLRDLAQDLLELDPGEGAFSALDLAGRLAVALESDHPAAYGVDLDGEAPRVGFAHGVDRWYPGIQHRMEEWFAARVGAGAPLTYDPHAPQPWQRNVVVRKSDLAQRGLPTAEFDRFVFGPVGMAHYDQLRVIVCEGPSVLAWIGAYHPKPFSERHRQAWSNVVPAIRSRLSVERRLADGVRASMAVSALLDQIGAPAFVLSAMGRIDELNAPAQALLERTRPETLEALRRARSDTPLPGTQVARLGRGMGGSGWLVTLPPTREPEDMRLRVSRLAKRAALTPAQARVVAVLADGLSNQGIAATLGLSRRTVESHLATIYDKLGVASRAGVLACLLEPQK